MTQPIAYLRKSVVTSDRHLSWEVQEQQVRALAARHGDTELTLLSDWGKSGRGEKTSQRKDYLRLKSMVASGQVTVIYSYSLSRLARSLREYADLAELCRDKDVRIRLCKEGELDYTTASGRFMVGMLALLAQMEAELAQERAKDTIAARGRRGDHIGQAPYGYRLAKVEVEGTNKKSIRLEPDPAQPVEPVLAAYREAGSYHGAARLLNARGMPTRGGQPWSDVTIRSIVARHAAEHPDLKAAVRATRTGAKARAKVPFLLAGLLRCHCGTILTGSHERVRQYGPYTKYVCWRARHDSTHVRPLMVSERVLLPWVQAEAALLRTPSTLQAAAEDAAAKRAELEERLRRVHAIYETHTTMTQAEWEAKVAAISGELARLDAAAQPERIEPLDWTEPIHEVNDHLRAIWSHVVLDEHMRPLRAEWNVPEWRADDPA